MEEFRKENSMIAGYYSGVSVKTGDPSNIPFVIDLIFPKSLGKVSEMAQRNPEHRTKLQLFLEDVLEKSLLLNIYYDDTIENEFSKKLTNSNKLGSEIFEEDLEKDAVFKAMNSIFELKYESSRQNVKTITFNDPSREAEVKMDPDDDENDENDENN